MILNTCFFEERPALTRKTVATECTHMPLGSPRSRIVAVNDAGLEFGKAKEEVMSTRHGLQGLGSGGEVKR